MVRRDKDDFYKWGSGRHKGEFFVVHCEDCGFRDALYGKVNLKFVFHFTKQLNIWYPI